MQLTDTKNNTKITYVYVNDFEWLDTEIHEDCSGHPKKGEVYRAVFNTDTKTYRIFYEIEGVLNGIYLRALKSNDEDNYRGDLTEITRSSVIELQLKESQLDSLLKWEKEHNKSVNDFMEIPAKEQVPQQLNAAQVKDFIRGQEELAEFKELGDFLGQLTQTDPVLYTALSEFIYSLQDHPVEVIDTSWPNMSAVLGAGTNISKAIKHIAIYGGDDRKTNLDTGDLLIAMRALLEELTRRQFHTL